MNLHALQWGLLVIMRPLMRGITVTHSLRGDLHQAGVTVNVNTSRWIVNVNILSNTDEGTIKGLDRHGQTDGSRRVLYSTVVKQQRTSP